MGIYIIWIVVITITNFRFTSPASISKIMDSGTSEDNEVNSSDDDISFPAEPLNPSEFEAAKLLQEKHRVWDSNIYENEVLYSKSFQKQLEIETHRNGLVDERKRWPRVGDNVLIPYIISSKFDQRQRQVIAKAFQDFHENTCIRFVPRINQQDYVHIIQGSGCDSDAGRIGGEQTLSLGNGCDYVDTAIHELNHAVGFWHEQNRPDRDNFVIVYLTNVIPENRFNFDKMSTRQVNALDVEYDTNSIMHYDKFAFSKDPKRLVVMEPKTPNDNMGLAKTLSKSDILRIRRMYKCGVSNSQKHVRDGQDYIKDDDMVVEVSKESIECSNFHPNCTLFARVSKCEDNAWVKISCREACGTCGKPCQDMNLKCPVWAAKGACDVHLEYMRLYCPKSCQICQNQKS